MSQLTPERPVWATTLGAGLVLAAAAYVFALVVARAAGVPIESYRIASAAVGFVVVGLIERALSARPVEPPPPERFRDADWTERRRAWIAWGAFTAGTFALYWPTLAVGLLSDDFGHVVRSDAWAIGPVTTSFFRPLPLAMWALIQHAGGGATALHTVNLLLHGANAFLVMRLCAGWFPRQRVWSWLAGALFLLNPLAVEAVAWASGIFDLSATMLTLAAILIARRSPTMTRRVLFFVTLAAALGCKETAVVAPVLVLVDAYVRRDLRKDLLRDAGIAVLLCAAVSAFRLVQAFGVSAPPLTKYVVQRTIFETFGSFGSPVRADIRHGLALSAAAVFCALAAWTASFLRRDVPWRALAGTVAWIVVSIAPMFPIVVVGADLQGSRYLYLGACAWMTLMTGIAATMRRAAVRRSFYVLWIAAAVMLGIATRAGLKPWTEAARTRDAVFGALAAQPAIASCQVLALADLPDNVRGAYVFRTDADAAFRLVMRLTLAPVASPPCTLTWRDGRFN